MNIIKFRPKQSIPSLFSLSHPLDELKPVMHKPNMSPGIYRK